MTETITGFFRNTSQKAKLFWIVLILTGILYIINFSVNDIWTENESFYAESAREMVESGNFLEINFNYQPRFNKPPLTYWLVAASTKLLGKSEFAVRLPIIILAFWTTLLVWSIARMLYGEKTALLAFAMQAISIQFIAGKQYASPEIPLAFFFTLTLYFFLKGELSGKSRYYRFAALSLGLTVLTKGYPYIIVIGGIILLYLLIESHFQWRPFFKKLNKLKPLSFMAIVSIVGLSWVALMYLHYGNNFLEVLNQETLERALAKDSNWAADLFFYPEVILWGFFPYSLLFTFACFHFFFTIRNIKEIAFGFSWFMVMLIIFSAASGKIPTYFIQAHPALSLISAHFISRYTPAGRVSKILWNVVFLLPAAMGIILSIVIIWIFSLPVIYCMVPAAALLLMGYAWLPQKNNADDGSLQSDLRYFQPFIGTFSALLIFSIAVVPELEMHRPVNLIGRVINQELHIPKQIPLYLQDDLIHNLPFYAERKVITDAIPDEIFQKKRELLALVTSNNVPDSVSSSVIWKGDIYRRRSSESRLLLFIESHLKAKKGDMSGFTNYSLIYKK
ncbi:MAG: glycosyltransferase family 39 protein [Chlorobium sp.]|nr:MAG: glycosyltransferase family 39 protein [Chlorobium sp.]